MQVYIITSAKFEECYIEEWVKYHLNMGFDKIIINDNNPKDYKYPLTDILKKYIDEGTVIVERYYDTHQLEHHVQETEIYKPYTWLYNKYKGEFDWCAKLDIDEYLEIPETNNDIKTFVNQTKFENSLSILIQCILYIVKEEYSYQYTRLQKNRYRYINAYNDYEHFECGYSSFKPIIRSTDLCKRISQHEAMFDDNTSNLIKYAFVDGNDAYTNFGMSNNLFTSEQIDKLFKDNKKYFYNLTNICTIKHYCGKSIEDQVNHCIKFEADKYNDWCLHSGYKYLLQNYKNMFDNPRDLYKIYFIDNINNINNTTVYIITSAKYEECYIEEWVKYHLNMGFDKIIINDNNPKDYKYQLKDILKKYIEDETVIIEHYYDTHQLPTKIQESDMDNVYTWLYNKYKGEFDWCAKLDIDEYLEISETNNDIKTFVNQEKFENSLSILMPWQLYKIKYKYSYQYTRLKNNKDKYEINNDIDFCESFFKPLIKSTYLCKHIYPHFVIFDDNTPNNFIKYSLPDGKDASIKCFYGLPEYNDIRNKRIKQYYEYFINLRNIMKINHYCTKSKEEEALRYLKMELYKIDDEANKIYNNMLNNNPNFIKKPRDLYKIYFIENENNI